MERSWLVILGSISQKSMQDFFSPMAKRRKGSKGSPMGQSKGTPPAAFNVSTATQSTSKDVQATPLAGHEVETLIFDLQANEDIAAVAAAAPNSAPGLSPHQQDMEPPVPLEAEVAEGPTRQQASPLLGAEEPQPAELQQPPTAGVQAEDAGTAGEQAAADEQAEDVNADQGRGRHGSWVNVLEDNRKTKMAMPLQQSHPTGKRLCLEYEDIKTVEDSIGF